VTRGLGGERPTSAGDSVAAIILSLARRVSTRPAGDSGYFLASPLKGMPLMNLTIHGTAATDLKPPQGMQLEEIRVKNVNRIAEVLRAEAIAELPETADGTFGAARLGNTIGTLQARLEPGQGKRRVPSGLNVKLLTWPVCPLKVRLACPSRHDPHLHRLVNTRADQPLAGRA